MNLKLKAKIYQYTGLYLAEAEERAHLELPTTKLQIFKIHGSETWEEPSLDDSKNIAIGLWQMKHGFHRPISFLKFDYPNKFGRTAAWVAEFWQVLCYDIRSLYERR